MRVVVGWCLSACLFLLVPSGLPSRAEAQVDSSSDAEARRRFDEGRNHFSAGEFTEAAQAFRRAYLLSPRYALLYNIGQSELRAGRDAEALEAFEGFLRQAPADDPRRSEVEERARVLRGMGVAASTGTVVASGTGVTAAGGTGTTGETGTTSTEAGAGTAGAETGGESGAETGDTSADLGSTGSSTAGGDAGPAPWILVGVGAAVAIVGGILVGVGAADAGAVTGAAEGTFWRDIEGAAGRANAEFGAGVVLLAVGVAAVGAGVVWAVAGAGSGESASARVTFGPGSIALSGEF